MQDSIYTFAKALLYLKRYKNYWFWFGVRAAYVAIGVIMPVVLGLSIDTLSAPHVNLARLEWLAGIYGFLLLISPGLEVLTASKSVRIGASIANDFRKDALELIERAPLDFFKSKSHGEYIKIIAEAYEAIYRVSEDISHRYLPSVGSVVGIFISTIILKPFVVVVFICGAALWLLNLIIVGGREKISIINYMKQEEVVTGSIMEFLNNFKTIFYLNLFKKQRKELSMKMDRAYSSRELRIQNSMRKWYNHSQLQAIMTIAILTFCLVSVVKGNFTVGIMVVILSFSGSLAAQMSILVDYAEQLTMRSAALMRYREEIETPLLGRTAANTQKIFKFEDLSASNLTVIRDGRDNLREVSFSIQAGEKVAVIGNTGGGKSTLLDVILKGFTAYDGDISINGINYKTLNDKDLVDIFSIIPQEVQLFRGTLKENIASSRRSPNKQEMTKLLEICRLERLAESLDTSREVIYEGSANISGGEKQRIGIARALFQNHPFLILDEATASLDPRTEKAVMDSIFQNYPDLTLLHVTHRYSLLDKFDKILLLNEGRLVQAGSYAALKESSPLFRELYMSSYVSEA